MEKRVYYFGEGASEGQGLGKDLLGGKGSGLAEMTALGIPVPPGFTITTAVCREFFDAGDRLPEGLEGELFASLERVGAAVGAVFGDPSRPLLVSVRSGARASMPGMMDTVLNLGLNDVTVEGLSARTQNPRFAWDAYRRFLTMYANVVLGRGREPFEEALQHARLKAGVRHDHEVPAEALRALVEGYKKLLGESFPQDPRAQLLGAVGAVFRSWHNDRARVYRKMNGIPDAWGTACTVQAMVFGNLGDTSATGVAFTRDSNTGERRLNGEYLPNAQGEDVVAGIRTGHKLTTRDALASYTEDSLEARMPEAFARFSEVAAKLEAHFRDMQDLEFTIQDGRLWLLQTRSAKRTMRAAVRAAVEMVREGLLTRDEALLRVEAGRLPELFLPRLDEAEAKSAEAKGLLLGKGLGASMGYACGAVVFTADEAEREAAQGRDVLLVRRETSPEDIHGMHAARGILTATGGLTSHAAVVARGMGKCCVAGCSAISVDYRREVLRVTTPEGAREFKKGDVLTLDGTTGRVFLGRLKASAAVSDAHLDEVLAWADDKRRLGVRANADTPLDARNARRFGAEGIGLCRTEHMFFEADRIAAVREMILADDTPSRQRALDKILPMQREDFVGIFNEMKGLPITIRLLDPPLHEFLPEAEGDLVSLAKELGVSLEVVKVRNEALREFNPMLGHRGCRLGLVYPEIYATQARAIAEAVVLCARGGADPRPEVMIPLVAAEEELRRLRALVVETMDGVFAREGVRVPYLVGTMLELPRACLVADRIAAHAEFFSFGTNDLTQTTWGLSRDDAGRFLPFYVDQKVLPADPFATLDADGVGALMKLGVERGRGARPGLKVGICGEHGGDPASVGFCHGLGLDYVSCSPFRVPTARLAAAQAALRG
ncbi:MAG: pyruvate, phosphate dikinase [Deltaproteobacteria bacterium]|nr:pyruvate, phosphate dikinase [Deltaproteobacteria bacterium]